jgi:hypothetical protein
VPAVQGLPLRATPAIFVVGCHCLWRLQSALSELSTCQPVVLAVHLNFVHLGWTGFALCLKDDLKGCPTGVNKSWEMEFKSECFVFGFAGARLLRQVHAYCSNRQAVPLGKARNNSCED